jgi:hypothetical protein
MVFYFTVSIRLHGQVKAEQPRRTVAAGRPDEAHKSHRDEARLWLFTQGYGEKSGIKPGKKRTSQACRVQT